MKKIVLIIVLFISILFTASCDNNRESKSESCDYNYCYIIDTKQYIKIKDFQMGYSGSLKIYDENDNCYYISTTNWILCQSIGDIEEMKQDKEVE